MLSFFFLEIGMTSPTLQKIEIDSRPGSFARKVEPLCRYGGFWLYRVPIPSFWQDGLQIDHTAAFQRNNRPITEGLSSPCYALLLFPPIESALPSVSDPSRTIFPSVSSGRRRRITARTSRVVRVEVESVPLKRSTECFRKSRPFSGTKGR